VKKRQMENLKTRRPGGPGGRPPGGGRRPERKEGGA